MPVSNWFNLKTIIILWGKTVATLSDIHTLQNDIVWRHCNGNSYLKFLKYKGILIVKMICQRDSKEALLPKLL